MSDRKFTPLESELIHALKAVYSGVSDYTRRVLESPTAHDTGITHILITFGALRLTKAALAKAEAPNE